MTWSYTDNTVWCYCNALIAIMVFNKVLVLVHKLSHCYNIACGIRQSQCIWVVQHSLSLMYTSQRTCPYDSSWHLLTCQDPWYREYSLHTYACGCQQILGNGWKLVEDGLLAAISRMALHWRNLIRHGIHTGQYHCQSVVFLRGLDSSGHFEVHGTGSMIMMALNKAKWLCTWDMFNNFSYNGSFSFSFNSFSKL